MKKFLKRTIVILMIFILSIRTISVNAAVKSKSSNLKFGVISDIHINNQDKVQDEKLVNALNMLNDVSKNGMDALVVAGDITDSGQKASYKRFNKICDSILGKKIEKVLIMGNHEYYNKLSASESQKRFKAETGEKINTRKVIKGYNFITVSTENAALEGTFGDKTKQWLSKQLEECNKEDSQKPIFVIVHQPVKNTVYGSERACTDVLYSILAKYPQVICFTGHSHYPLNDERCISQNDFTAVAAGTLQRVDIDEDFINRKEFMKKDISQGLFVEVDNKKVVITRIDFLNNKIMSNKWVIDVPSSKKNFKYTYARKLERNCPYFKADAECIADIRNDKSVEVTFSKAYHDDFVHSYKISLINNDTNEVESEFLFINDFFVEDSADKFKIKLSNINKGVNYKIKIKAIESFGNESADFLQCDFKI